LSIGGLFGIGSSMVPAGGVCASLPNCIRDAIVRRCARSICRPEAPAVMPQSQLPSEPKSQVRAERVHRAVLVVDMVESVRQMEQDEDGTITRWRSLLDRLEEHLSTCSGARLVKSLGDGVLVDFDRAQQALEVGVWLHAVCERLAQDAHPDLRMRLRMGLHSCWVVRDHRDIFGSGVNLAARLAALARPGGIVATVQAVGEIQPPPGICVEDLGACHLKHVDRPIKAYRIFTTPGPPLVRVLACTTTSSLDRPSLTVPPFTTQVGELDSEFVGQTIADLLNRSLSNSSAIKMVRMETDRLDSPLPLRIEEASARGAGYVLTGSVVKRANRMEVSARLFDTHTARQRWAGRFVVDAAFAIDGKHSLIETLNAAIHRAILDHEHAAVKVLPHSNLSSLSLQSAAVSMMHAGLACDFENAHGILECVVDRHPRHAMAHAWLAQWYVLKVMRGLMGREAASASALWHAQRALELDPKCSIALAVQGYAQCHILHDLPKALNTLDEMTSRFPYESLGWTYKSVVSGLSGDRNDAVNAMQNALRLPATPPIRRYRDAIACTTSLSNGQLGKTIHLAKRSLATNPIHSPTWRALAIAQVRMGQMEEAKRTVRVLRELQPDLSVSSYLAMWPTRVRSGHLQAAEDLHRAGVPEAPDH